jgi:hypothetical protein
MHHAHTRARVVMRNLYTTCTLRHAANVNTPSCAHAHFTFQQHSPTRNLSHQQLNQICEFVIGQLGKPRSHTRVRFGTISCVRARTRGVRLHSSATAARTRHVCTTRQPARVRDESERKHATLKSHAWVGGWCVITLRSNVADAQLRHARSHRTHTIHSIIVITPLT